MVESFIEPFYIACNENPVHRTYGLLARPNILHDSKTFFFKYMKSINDGLDGFCLFYMYVYVYCRQMNRPAILTNCEPSSNFQIY